MANLLFLAAGLVFGFLLSRGGASDFDYIQRMFLLSDFQMYGIIGTAVVVAAPFMFVLRRRGRGFRGQPLEFRPKPVHRGNVVGGAIFGVGWVLTGYCPGPLLVSLGEGKLYAVGAFAGMLTGVWLVARFYEPLQRGLGLPGVGENAGGG